MKKICFAVIAAFIVICILNTVQAVTSEELEQKRLELQKQINEAGLEIENIEIELTETLEKINSIDEEIYNYEQNVASINESLNTLEQEIISIEKQLEILQKDYDYIKQVFTDRIVYLYETGETRYLDVLLNSKSIVEFISNYYLIGEMAEYDANLITKVQKDKENIEEIQKNLESTRQELKDKKIEEQKNAITLENSKIVKNSYLNSLTKEETELQEKIEKYQEELDIIELEMLISSTEGNNSQYVGGTFLWPLPGHYTITSKYGMRLHPILKVYRGHSGMDIAAPQGTYIVAANSGIVTKATYSISYGNLVMINHGNGVSTAYAHGSEILVQVGQEVQRGDIIMKVGSTGWSTGPHLHFEIIVNGSTIDPYPYVTSNTSN